MRPVRNVEEEENWRTEPMIAGSDKFAVSRRDFVEPEPIGSIVLLAFRVTGYDADCDGSAMARLEHVDKDGDPTGYSVNRLGLCPDTELVVDLKELAAIFAGVHPGSHGLLCR